MDYVAEILLENVLTCADYTLFFSLFSVVEGHMNISGSVRLCSFDSKSSPMPVLLVISKPKRK